MFVFFRWIFLFFRGKNRWGIFEFLMGIFVFLREIFVFSRGGFNMISKLIKILNFTFLLMINDTERNVN